MWEGITALLPAPVRHFDRDKMDPIEGPPDAICLDDFDDFGAERWTEADPTGDAPELDLGDGRRLVLDAPNQFSEVV